MMVTIVWFVANGELVRRKHVYSWVKDDSLNQAEKNLRKRLRTKYGRGSGEELWVKPPSHEVLERLRLNLTGAFDGLSRNNNMTEDERDETKICINSSKSWVGVFPPHHPEQSGERGRDVVGHHPCEEHRPQGAVQVVLHEHLQEHVRCPRRAEADHLWKRVVYVFVRENRVY